MSGFIALLSFLAAMAEGSWYWLFFIVSLLFWINKLAKQQKNINSPMETSVNTSEPIASYKNGLNKVHLYSDRIEIGVFSLNSYQYDEIKSAKFSNYLIQTSLSLELWSGKPVATVQMWNKDAKDCQPQLQKLIDTKNEAKNASLHSDEDSYTNVKKPQMSNQYINRDWINRLTELCFLCTSQRFYRTEFIPKNKMENAIKHFPLSDGGKVIALIDTTVLGSAKNGMLIGEYGLSWHNSISDKVWNMSWERFSELSISIDKSKIKIGKDAVFETMGIFHDIKEFKFFLESIADLWSELAVGSASPDSKSGPEVSQAMPTPSSQNEQAMLDQTDINIADFDSLLTLPGIGIAEAKLLIQHRDSQGPFASMDELEALLKMKPHIVEQLRSRLSFSQGSTKEASRSRIDSPPLDQSPTKPTARGPFRAPVDF